MSTADASDGLAMASILIIIRTSAAYSLMAGAFLGGIQPGFGTTADLKQNNPCFTKR